MGSWKCGPQQAGARQAAGQSLQARARWNTVFMASMALVITAGLRPVQAQPAVVAETQVFSFDVPPAPLGDALLSVSTTAGVRVFFEPERVAGVMSQGVRGRHTAERALELLLEGTGFVSRSTGPASVRLEAAPRPQGVSSEAVNGQALSEALIPSLPMVTVHGKAESDAVKDQRYRSAGSSHALSRDDIERFRGTSVGDIFQGTPGVLIGENRNSGGLDVNIRGMQGQGRVPVLVDGGRQETTVYRGYAGVSSRSYVDPDLIGGIQIDKGPTMASGGNGAIGGLVSMRTLNADDIVQPGKSFGMRLRGSAIGNNSGSPSAPGTAAGYNVSGLLGDGVYRTDCVTPSLCSGQYSLDNVFGSDATMDRPAFLDLKGWAGSLALAKRVEAADFVAAYAQRSQGNYYAGKHGHSPTIDLSERYPRGFWTEVRPKLDGDTRFRAQERVVNSNYESRSLLLKARFYLPDEQELELSHLRYQSVFGELMPSQLLWLGSARQTDNSRVQTGTTTAQYHWKPQENELIDLRVNLWHTDTDSVNRGYSAEMAELIGDSMNSSEQYRRTGLDVSNSMRFTPSWGAVKVDYGASLQWENVSSEGEADDSAGLYFRNGHRQELGLFAAVQWQPVSRVTLDAGVRYTRFKSKDDNAAFIARDSSYCMDADSDGRCDPIYPTSKNSGSAPIFSAMWEPVDGLQFHGRYAEALRMPSLFETTAGFSVSPTLDTVLRPERARNREFGVNYLKNGLWRTDDKLRLRASYFRNHTSDYLTRTIPNAWEDTSTGASATLFRMRNIKSADFHGFEVSGSYDMGWLFTEFGGTRYITIQTCHYGSYRREDCTDYGIANSYINNMIPPKWHGNVTVGTRLFERRLTLGVRSTFMGERTRVPQFDDQTAGGLLQPVPWRRYRIFDLFTTFKVNEQVSVDFNVDNFTDRYYLDALSLGLVPAPGRTARLSATVLF